MDESVLKEQLSALLVLFDEKAAAYFEAAQLPDLTPARAIKLEMSRLYNNAFGLYLLLFPDAGEADFAACLKSEHPASYEAYEAARSLPMTDPVFTEPLNGEKVFRVYDGAKFTVDFTLRGEIVFPVKDSASRVNAREYWEGVRAELITPAAEIRAAFEALTAAEEGEACELAVLDAAFFYGEEALDISGCEIIVTASPKIDTSSKVTEKDETELIFRAWQCGQSGEITALTASETDASHSAGGAAVFALSPGSSIGIEALKSGAGPQFMVQYYANVRKPDFNATCGAAVSGGGRYWIPMINTDINGTAVLPHNGGGNPILYMAAEKQTDDRWKVKFKYEDTEIYNSREFSLLTSPGIKYVNLVTSDYYIDSVKVTIGSNTTIYNGTAGYTDLENAIFTMDDSAAPDKIHIEAGCTVRINYTPKTGSGYDGYPCKDFGTKFWDYDITNGQHDSSNQWYTDHNGINGYYSESDHYRLTFGNTNTGVRDYALAQVGNTYNINYRNSSNEALCCFGILDPTNPEKFASNTNLNGKTISYLYDGTTQYGKTEAPGYKLRFQQAGYNFSLVDVRTPDNSSAVTYWLDTFSYLATTVVPGNYQYANDFWPMDTVSWWKNVRHGENTGTHDPKWGWPQDVKFTGAEIGTFPASDDQTYDHNCLFGMNFDVDFQLDKDYIGPLNYLFCGDDDLWVYLQKINANGSIASHRLICDLGGVHLSMGEYVNLRNYLPNGSSGHYRLHVMYNERGNSGSNCYISFCLPGAVVPEIRPYGEAWLDKKVKGFHSNEDVFWFKFDIEGSGTAAPTPGYRYPYDVYENYESFRNNEDPVRSGGIVDGGSLYLHADEFVRIAELPVGSTITWEETPNEFYTTCIKWEEIGNVAAPPNSNTFDWADGYAVGVYKVSQTIAENSTWYERYINEVITPPAGEVWLEKEVTDIHNYVPDDAEFTFRLDIDYTGFTGGDEPANYTYYIYDSYDDFVASPEPADHGYSSTGVVSNHGTIKLKDGQFARVTGIPLEAKTTWTEESVTINGVTTTMTADDTDNWWTWYKWDFVYLDGDLPAVPDWSGEYLGNTDYWYVYENLAFFDHFRNEYVGEDLHTDEIWLEKKVEPENEPCDDEFTFTVDFTGDADGGSYTYYIYNSYDDFYNNRTHAETGTIADGGTVKLKKDQFVRIVGLPAGSGYTWTETVPAGYETPVVTTNSYYCKEVTAVSEIVQGGYYLLGAEYSGGLYIMGTDVQSTSNGRYPYLHKVTADNTGNKIKISASGMTRDWALYAKSSGGKYSFRNGVGFLAFDGGGFPIFSGTLDDYSKWYVTPVSGESGVFCFQNYEWQKDGVSHDSCKWIYGASDYTITYTSSEDYSKLKLYRITVPEAYQTVTNTFTNTRKKYPVNLEKRSMTADGAAVAGAKFKLEAADAGWAALSPQPNGFPKTATSAADGKINFTDLLPGNYLLTETEAPDGYYLAAAPWHITVAADGAVTVQAKNGTSGNYEAVPVNNGTPVIINMTSYELPSTGGTGILPYTFGGLLLAAIPLMYFGYCTRRRKKGGGKI